MNICTWTDKSQDTERTPGRQNRRVPVGLLDRYCSSDLRDLTRPYLGFHAFSFCTCQYSPTGDCPPPPRSSFRKPRLRASVGKNREADGILRGASGVNPS